MKKNLRFISGSNTALRLKASLMLTAIFSLTACGGGGSSEGGNSGGSIPGTTFSAETTMVKGLVSGASCELFEIDASGSKGASVAPLGTTVNGLADFGDNIEYQGTALIECTGGTYRDEATNNSMTAPLLRAVVNLNGNTSAVVSPLTEIATQLAETANNLSTAITIHNNAVADAFGFDGNITDIIPTDLSSSPASINDAGTYGTLLAMISQLNANAPGSLAQLINDLATDLADGVFSNTSLSEMSTALADLTAPQSPIGDNISATIIANIIAATDIPTGGDGGNEIANQPNILIILSDDQGVDSSAEYDYSQDPPHTPTLSALAADGLVFQNAWVTPACASTRASLLTGQHGIHNGVPTVPGNLDEGDEIIYEYLAAQAETSNYASAFIGKWHVGTELINGEANPVGNGVQYFAGSVQGNVNNYFSWDLTIDSPDTAINSSVSTDYNTSVLTDLAEQWIADQTAPWFMVLGYNAPHSPVHLPDSSLHTRDDLTANDCNNNPRACYLAMIEAMDTEIGNLLGTMSQEERDNTLILFVGDNGTANGQRDPAVFGNRTVKGSLFDGGMRVPFFASGAGVTRSGEREYRLVTVTDIYATVAEIAGAEVEGAINDSISFAGYLDSEHGENRQHAYTDWENGTWAIRNHTHHMITEGRQTLYRLDDDGSSHSHVIVNDENILFELRVEAARIREELGTFTANPNGAALDITDGTPNGTYTVRASTCARYVRDYTATATDLNGASNNQNDDQLFTANMSISVANGNCSFNTDGIPNHDMQDTGSFANDVSEQNDFYQVPAAPEFAANTTVLEVGQEQGIYLNGVKIDIFAAACLGVDDERIGCGANTVPEADEWRFDPMFAGNGFTTDSHNAHTQPNGAYHYHGSPNALFDGTGDSESGTVGFAADGFPIYGLYIEDDDGVREVQSSYQLIQGNRPTLDLGGSSAQHSGQPYDGTFRQDYEYVEGSGDLDECNGMFKDGSYGYYVTSGFPYIVGCFKGTPDASFVGGGGNNNNKIDILH